MINALYYDKGYLSVQVATPRVMLTPDRNGIEITIAITEGPRYRIRQMRVYERDEDGREIEPLGGRRHLREMIRAKPGDYFNRAELVKDLGAVQTLYRDAGYANVEAPPATELDPEREEVDIIVAIRRHQPVRFGRIEIRGNTKTRDKVIRREMEIAESDLFSETKLERSKRRITALGYFERVDISTEQGDDPAHVNVNVEIGEKRRARSRSAPASPASRTSSPPRRCSRRTSSATASRSRCRRRSRASASSSTCASSSRTCSTAPFRRR